MSIFGMTKSRSKALLMVCLLWLVQCAVAQPSSSCANFDNDAEGCAAFNSGSGLLGGGCMICPDGLCQPMGTMCLNDMPQSCSSFNYDEMGCLAFNSTSNLNSTSNNLNDTTVSDLNATTSSNTTSANSTSAGLCTWCPEDNMCMEMGSTCAPSNSTDSVCMSNPCDIGMYCVDWFNGQYDCVVNCTFDSCGPLLALPYPCDSGNSSVLDNSTSSSNSTSLSNSTSSSNSTGDDDLTWGGPSGRCIANDDTMTCEWEILECATNDNSSSSSSSSTGITMPGNNTATGSNDDDDSAAYRLATPLLSLALLVATVAVL